MWVNYPTFKFQNGLCPISEIPSYSYHVSTCYDGFTTFYALNWRLDASRLNSWNACLRLSGAEIVRVLKFSRIQTERSDPIFDPRETCGELDDFASCTFTVAITNSQAKYLHAVFMSILLYVCYTKTVIDTFTLSWIMRTGTCYLFYLTNIVLYCLDSFNESWTSDASCSRLLNPSSTLNHSHIHRTHIPIPLLSLGWRIGPT